MQMDLREMQTQDTQASKQMMEKHMPLSETQNQSESDVTGVSWEEVGATGSYGSYVFKADLRIRCGREGPKSSGNAFSSGSALIYVLPKLL